MLTYAGLQVMLNAGDHKHMKQAFLDTLTKMGITKMQVAPSSSGLRPLEA